MLSDDPYLPPELLQPATRSSRCCSRKVSPDISRTGLSSTALAHFPQESPKSQLQAPRPTPHRTPIAARAPSLRNRSVLPLQRQRPSSRSRYGAETLEQSRGPPR